MSVLVPPMLRTRKSGRRNSDPYKLSSALQSSQPMQLGRHEKPSGEQLVGGTKRFVIVRNLTPDAKSYAWFRRFPASDRMKTATVHGHKGGPRWAALECASEEDAMRLAKEVAAFEVPAEASGPFQVETAVRTAVEKEEKLNKERELRGPGITATAATAATVAMTEGLRGETIAKRSGVKIAAKSAGMIDRSAGMTDGKIVGRNVGMIVEMTAETTGETSAAKIAEMTGERSGGTSGETTGETTGEMIGEIRGNTVMTASSVPFAWKIGVMTGVTIADTSEEKIEHMKEMRGEMNVKVTAEVIAERSGTRIVMTGMDDRSSAGTIVRSITDEIPRKSSRAPGTMTMDLITVGKTDAKSDAMIGEMTDGTTVGTNAEMIGGMKRDVTTGGERPREERWSEADVWDPFSELGPWHRSSPSARQAGIAELDLGIFNQEALRFLWLMTFPAILTVQDRDIFMATSEQHFVLSSIERCTRLQLDAAIVDRSDGEALPGQLAIQNHSSAPQPSIAPALRDIDRTRREQARSEAEKKAVAAEQASLEKQKEASRFFKFLRQQMQKPEAMQRCGGVPSEAIRANERLQNAKRKAEEVGLALQEQQKRAKALYDEAQAKMKEAELAEQASLEASGAAERYKVIGMVPDDTLSKNQGAATVQDYSAQADRDAQQASMEAARLAKDAAVAKQEDVLLRPAEQNSSMCKGSNLAPSYPPAASEEAFKLGSQDDDNRPLRSKGLLPAIGVGAAVYWITGIASMTTLGLVGIGAGVGYGVGSWIADKMQKKGDGQNKVQMDQLPWAVQVALQHWQEFVTRQAAGRQLTPADVDAIWAQFEQYEPTHAANARALVRGSGAASSSSSQGPASFSSGTGPTFVATQAAEV
ncbi:PGA [Symbiodinium sp. CCMP2592]|nr:PGA [Symbiodinium sp. CCMP2592]